MELAPFEMMKAIDTYNNEAHRRHIDRNNLFGMESLSKENQKVLCDALTLIEKAPLLFNTELSAKEHADIRRGVLVKAKCGQLGLVHKDLQKLAVAARDTRIQRWYHSEQKSWSRNEKWGRLLRTIPTQEKKNELLTLKNSWDQQAWFSHYPSAALWYVINEIYPVIRSYFDLNALEFKARRFRIPRRIRREYKAYLKKAEQEITQLHDQLIGSMLARFEVMGLQDDLTNDDMINFMHAWMKRHRFRVSGCASNMVRRGMTQDLFSNFHRYIEINGNSNQQERLLKLPWSQHPALKMVTRGEGWLLVPKLLVEKKLISSERRKFSRLSKQSKRRVEFYRERLWLMVALAQLGSWNVAEVPAAKSIEVMADISRELSQADAVIDAWDVSGWRRYIHYKNSRFVTIWKQFSGLARKILANKYIELMEAANTQRWRASSSEIREVGAKTLTYEQVQGLVDSADSAISYVQLSEELQEKFEIEREHMLGERRQRSRQDQHITFARDRFQNTFLEEEMVLDNQGEIFRNDNAISTSGGEPDLFLHDMQNDLSGIMADLDSMLASNDTQKNAKSRAILNQEQAESIVELALQNRRKNEAQKKVAAVGVGVNPEVIYKTTSTRLPNLSSVVADYSLDPKTRRTENSQSDAYNLQANQGSEIGKLKTTSPDIIGVLQLAKNMDVMALAASNFDQMLSTLESVSGRWSAGNNEVEKLVNTTMQHLFKCYLQYCISLHDASGFKAAQDKLYRLEKLLMSKMAPDFIRGRIDTLIKSRQQDGWWFMFYMQCSAFKQSCCDQTSTGNRSIKPQSQVASNSVRCIPNNFVAGVFSSSAQSEPITLRG